ncbi:golgin subfamily A member 5-like [Centruroides sculpturatus]|uniref:golgin subfamily A member 5-like n=1 Tax=Centruroides sculpturatus TaxID=218467 RepID=UPI000C6D85A6|nr:golgin subfamily A member 5-like [Centruroides sculpturatus]XP_023226729.1 golgin subfamily A member 5-like [Centruroides sculpturatus]XP_023226730.1 golgin subfamily A member 5-like [Centruroides sculpturatus]
MSWLSGIVGKAEDLLNQVDQTAAQALHKSQTQSENRIGETFVNLNSVSQFPQTIGRKENYQMRSDYASAEVNKQIPSFSQKVTTTTKLSASPTKQAVGKSKVTDDDEKLLEFLNSNETISVSKKPLTPKNVSSPSFNVALEKKPEINLNLVKMEKIDETYQTSDNIHDTKQTKMNESENISFIAEKERNLIVEDKNIEEHNLEILTEEKISEMKTINQLPESSMINTVDDNLKKENELLRKEIVSLNQETTSLLHRNKDIEAEMKRMQKKLDHWNCQVSDSDRLIRELQEREVDLTASLNAKDSQLAVLRVRLQEADQELKVKRSLVEKLHTENERLLQDHNNSSGLHNQMLESVKEKLQETEMALQREKDAYKLAQAENMHRISQLEDEKQKLAESLTATQKMMAEEKAHNKELSSQYKFASLNLETLKREFSDYKQKAQRILQSKEKVISSLKDSQLMYREPGDGSETIIDSPALNVELEELRQECETLREELQRANKNAENFQSELQETERIAQNDINEYQDQLKNMEEQFVQEQQQRLSLEQECLQQKEEIKYIQEDLTRTKTNLQSRIQDRETEIEKLRKQLTAKSLSVSSQSELETRLHALTESLIQKQTVVEALSTEKNSLVLQLERLEQQLRELHDSGSRRQNTVVGIGAAELSHEKYQSKNNYFLESPYDGPIARKVKTVYGVIDSFSIRLGIFLRRYPIARIFVILYMFLLHLWVMIVLLTYTPEIHRSQHNSNQR